MRTRLFVKVYYEDLRRDYPEIYDDDAALAAWLRLLVIQDKMWPEPAELPRSVRARVLAVLTRAKLVAVAANHTFTVRGYIRERTARQATARNAAASRWAHADAHADADANVGQRESTEYRDRDSLRENGGRARGGLEKVGSVLPRLVG